MFSQSVAVVMSVYRSDELGNISAAVDSVLTQKNVTFVLYVYRDGVVVGDVDKMTPTSISCSSHLSITSISSETTI